MEWNDGDLHVYVEATEEDWTAFCKLLLTKFKHPGPAVDVEYLPAPQKGVINAYLHIKQPQK